MAASKWRGFAASLILVGATAGCSYNSDLFDFVSWENSDVETEPVALSNSQLEALRAKREAQLAELNDPSYQSVELDLPDLNRLTAGHIDAARRGAAALISDSAALLAEADQVDDTLDALIAEELAAIEDELGPTAAAPAPVPADEEPVFIIGSPVPKPELPPTPVETAALNRDPAAERRAAVRRALVRREEQNVVRRQLNYEDELAQRLQSAPDADAASTGAATGAARDAESGDPLLASLSTTPLDPSATAEGAAAAAAAAITSEPTLRATAAPLPAPVAEPSPSPAAAAAPTPIGAADRSGAEALADQLASALSASETAPAPSSSAQIETAPPASDPEPAADPETPSEPKQRGVIHTVKSDDTLAEIARQYNSTASAIRSANKLDANRGIFVGEELFVPQGLARRSAAAPPPSVSEAKPKAIPAARQLASPNLSQYQSDRAPVVTPPVPGGRIVLSYGDPDGEQLSTGIDIAAPVGTPVTAASDGRVAYLRKLGGRDGGSLVLVHADGMITRYSRLQNIPLRHGASVRRGQQIGEVGRPEGGREARLKFELLDGQDPVDPTQFFKASAR